MKLSEKGFGIEMEITAKIATLKIPVYEESISYHPRSFAEGKKITGKDGLRAVYLLAKYYFMDLHYGPVDKFIRYIRKRKALEKLTLLPNQTILDVGCGRQAFLGWEIKNKIKKYIGLDLTVPNVTVGNLTLVKTDIFSLKQKLSGQKCDTIVGLAIIEHLENPEKFLKDCYFLLKKSGNLVLTTPPPYTDFLLKLLAKIGVIDKKEIDDHKTYFTVDTLAEVAKNIGFTIESKEKFLFGLNTILVARK